MYWKRCFLMFLVSVKENSEVLGLILRDYNIIYSGDLREFVQLLSENLICQHQVPTSLIPLYFHGLLGFPHLLLYHVFLLAPFNCCLSQKQRKSTMLNAITQRNFNARVKLV